MRNDRQKVLALRLKGKSYTEINQLLGVPKSTLSGWLKNVQLPKEASRRIKNLIYKKSVLALIARNKKQTHLAEERWRNVRAMAQAAISPLSRETLLIAGIALYWAEGYKRPIIRDGKIRTHHRVSLTNSDPKLIKVFLRFLREVMKVPEDKIKASIRIYQHQNEANLLYFWSKETGIPAPKFGKTYYGISLSRKGRKPHNILPHGTIQVGVNDTALYHTIMGLIDGLIQKSDESYLI